MKESFERQLRQYRDEINDVDENGEQAVVQPANETQNKIFNIQIEKQRVMEELHEKFSLIDQPGPSLEQRAGGRVKTVKFRDGRFFASSRKNEEEQEITIGDILTAPEWGVRYSFDSDSVPRDVRKKLQVERAKIELKRLLKEQLLLNGIADESLSQHLRDTYRNTFRDFVRGEGKKIGLRSEKLIESFLKKLTYDYDLDFSIESTDVEDDVEGKIDFIIRRKIQKDGVLSVGVQVTVNDNVTTQDRKARKVEKMKGLLTNESKVDDMVFVSLPYQKEFKDIFSSWKLNKDTMASGPYMFLTEEEREGIFKAIFRDIFTPEEVEGNLQKMKTACHQDLI